MEARKGSVMERLNHVHDPRRREGKRYNLPGLIGMLLLAAVNGEASLRGMWLWGCGAWQQLAEPLDLWGTPGPPVYGTVWGLMAGIDAGELNQALCGAAAPAQEAGYAVDGKVLRGSRRGVAAALQVVTAAGHNCHTVLGEQAVTAGDQVEAAIALLQGLPLAGKLVSMDAGLLQRATIKVIEEKGGPTSGR
jgi:hypothetical protein